jgi:hypothetical protein
MLGLFSKYPISWAHGRTPVLKCGIGIHGGRSNRGLQLWLGVGVLCKTVTVEMVTMEGSTATDGSKMESAKNKPRREDGEG